MPQKLPQGLRQIGFQEKMGLFRNPGQVCGHENGIYEDVTGRFYGVRVLRSDSRDIDENLSIEEELVQQAEQGVLCLLFWRNENCVVIGRHQDPEAECRLDIAEKLGIRIAKRRTGGGAVFQDMGNLNVSFIAPANSLDEEICENILLKALAKCGVDARKTGRNDLVLNDAGPVDADTEITELINKKEAVRVGQEAGPEDADTEITELINKKEDVGAGQEAGQGGKFSGSASRETPEGIFLFHATLMFNVDLDWMTAVLNASPGKLARHGIASVRSRVTNLCEHYPDLKMEAVMQAIISESAAI